MKETRLEALIWEIKYHINEVLIFFRTIKIGITNLIYWFRIIWNNRWYDHAFTHRMLRHQLVYLRDNWKHSHYLNSEDEEKLLGELVDLLDEIEYIEDNDFSLSPKLSEKYQEFGRLLFDIHEKKQGDIVTKISNFERLWD